MSKRELTVKEKEWCSNSITHLVKETEWLEAQKEYFDFQVNKMLKLNYERTLEEYKRKSQNAEATILEHKESVKALEDQIANGVEEKTEESKESEKEAE